MKMENIVRSPHVIELSQCEYDKLFPGLNTQPEIEVLVNPFITAYQNDPMEQLEGQPVHAPTSGTNFFIFDIKRRSFQIIAVFIQVMFQII